MKRMLWLVLALQSAVQLPLAAQELMVRLRVLDEAGKPIRGATVGIARAGGFDLAALPAADRFATDAEGWARFPCPMGVGYTRLGKAPVELVVAAPGYVPRARWLYSMLNALAQRPVDDGQAAFELEPCHLRRGSPLDGRVRDERGRPLGGAQVEIHDLLWFSPFANYGARNAWTESQVVHSDARGRFRALACTPEGVFMRIRAKGFHTLEHSLVDLQRVAELKLTRGVEVTGRVTDGKGQPVQAYLQFVSESRAAHNYVTLPSTDEDGRFRLTPPGPGRWMLRAWREQLPGELRNVSVVSGVQDGAVKDLVLEMPGAARELRSLRLVDADTGAPVVGAYGVAMSVNPKYTNPLTLQNGFAVGWQRSGRDGRIDLLPRTNSNPEEQAMILAPGYASRIVSKLKQFCEERKKAGEDPPRLELVRGASLRGEVVDATSGKPVPRAMVKVLRQGGNDALAYWAAVVPAWAGRWVKADAQGRFAVTGLDAAEYRLQAVVQGRISGAPTTLRLEPGKEHAGLRLQLERGAVLRGRLVQARKSQTEVVPLAQTAGWRVSVGIGRHRNYSSYEDLVWSSGIGLSSFSPASYAPPRPTDAVPIAADGRFAVSGLGIGRYRLRLHLPALGRRGKPVMLDLEPFRCRGQDFSRVVPVGEDLPAVVRGRIRFTGARIDPRRLVIGVSTSTALPTNQQYSRTYERCLVEPDGSFVFLCPTNGRRLFITDQLYGKALYVAEEVLQLESGKETLCNVDLNLTRLRLRLTGDPGAVVSRIDWQVGMPANKLRSGFQAYRSKYGRRMFGERDLVLLVPVGALQVAVWSEAYSLNSKVTEARTALVGGELDLQAGKLNQLELRLPAPLELGGR